VSTAAAFTAERASRYADVVRVHKTKMRKRKIAHGASGGPDVERVSRRNQHYAEKVATWPA